jgi:hypothetical protein
MNSYKEIYELKRIIDGNCKVTIAMFKHIQDLTNETTILRKLLKDISRDVVSNETNELITKYLKKHKNSYYIKSKEIKSVIFTSLKSEGAEHGTSK